jgi:hypothetical protein
MAIVRVHTSNRQNAKEPRMAKRVWSHRKGLVRVIARRITYPAAIREVRECRDLRPDCRFAYLPSWGGGDGWNVVELERAR